MTWWSHLCMKPCRLTRVLIDLKVCLSICFNVFKNMNHINRRKEKLYFSFTCCTGHWALRLFFKNTCKEDINKLFKAVLCHFPLSSFLRDPVCPVKDRWPVQVLPAAHHCSSQIWLHTPELWNNCTFGRLLFSLKFRKSTISWCLPALWKTFQEPLTRLIRVAPRQVFCSCTLYHMIYPAAFAPGIMIYRLQLNLND